jgi:hypothetical protein
MPKRWFRCSPASRGSHRKCGARASSGTGRTTYKYASGREGRPPAAAFSARKAAAVLYVGDGIGSHTDALAAWDRIRPAWGCLYLNDLSAVDLGVLERFVTESYRRLTQETYRLRAREGGSG